MHCEAPKNPEGCVGAVGVYQGVPLCEGHRTALDAVAGPWRTLTGAREWLEAMASVVLARALCGVAVVGDRPEDPSGARAKQRPWINWSEGGVRGFRWIGGTPGWDSSDGRYRLVNSLGEDAQAKRMTKGRNAKKAEKDGKKARKFWHWNKFKTKKGRGGV